MVDPFQTLRFRLTGQYVVIFGLLQVFLWVTVYFIVNNHLRGRFDSELLRRAQVIAAGINDGHANSPDESISELARRMVAPFESEQFFILVTLRGDGPPIRSANAQGLSFPKDEFKAEALTQPVFMSLEPEQTGDVADGDAIRLVTLMGDENANIRFVQVGASQGPVQRTMLDIQRLLVVFVALSLLLAGISSWTVAGRTLRPINIIAREANRLTAAQLHQRITVPRQKDEVAEMVVAINDMLARLQAQFKNAHDFISNASHELKTPLAVMLGHVQNVRRADGNNETLRGFLQSTEEELWRMLKIVESCLILSRARSTEMLKLHAPVELEDAVIAAIRSCKADANKRNVKIVPSFTASDSMLDGPIVLGDADLLTTMVENLIGNAIRYTPVEGTVEVEVNSSVKEIALSIRDRGPGIPDQHLPRIFELCYQVDPKSENAGKSGIGLTIVQAVAELHGGSVEVENRQGGGCTFLVRLPRTRV